MSKPTVLQKLDPRDVDGADEVLSGVLLEFTSGNLCRCWPAMTRDEAKGQTRIAFFTEWLTPASPNDTADLIEFTNGIMGKQPELLTEGQGDAFNPDNLEWLRSGKPLKKGRVQ